MKISELILELADCNARFGDLEVELKIHSEAHDFSLDDEMPYTEFHKLVIKPD